MTVESGDTLTLTIERVTVRGAGVGRAGACEVHVHGAAPGDEVRATVEHVSPHRPEAFARLDEIATAGPGRRVVPCAQSDLASGACGGCAWLHLTDEARDAALLERVGRAFDAHHLTGPRPSMVHRAGSPTGWRNRSHRLAWSRDGATVLGARGRRGRSMADLSGCLIEQAPLPAVFDRIAVAANALGVPSEPAGGRGLRQVSARTNRAGDVLVELVVTSDVDIDPLVTAVAGIECVVGVHVAVHDGAANSTTEAVRRHVAGITRIVETCGPLEVPLGPSAFFQLNTAVAEAMYAQAAAWCEGATCVADLYAGIGGLGLTIARLSGAAVRAWEVHVGAIAAGRALSDALGVAWTGAVADLERASIDLGADVDRIVVNPPRRGLSRAVVDTLRHRPELPVLYMSCSPESLARDLAALARPVRRVEAWDMMPGTPHLELLVELGPVERAT